eukprot:4266568-Prymnesium_polylepis.1
MLGSLLVALVLEVYACEMENVTRNTSKDKMSLLTETIVPSSSTRSELLTVLSPAVRNKFNQYDADRSGALQVDEIQQLLEDLGDSGLSREEATQVMQDVDLDLSGIIEFDEFLPWWRERAVFKIFAKHDADSSGTIDLKELPGVMTELGISLSEEKYEDALNALDSDQSGSVSFQEYVRWFEDFDMRAEFEKYDRDLSGSINRR